MKKLCKVTLFLMLILTGVFMRNISKASETTYVHNGTYGYTTESEDVYEIADGVKHIINTGTGISESGKTLKPGRINHIYVADVKNNEDLKIVTWAVEREDKSGFIRAALLDIAKDYEAKHPGWIILAGTNADQFYTGFGTGLGSNGTDYFAPQPYYPYISDGDNLFAYSPYANCNNVAGFKNNRDDVQIEYGVRSVSGLYVHVYDENGSEIGKFAAKDLNLTEEIGANETTVLAPYTSPVRSLTPVSKRTNGDFYVVENPDISYVSNSKEWTYKEKQGYNVNAFFGKGKISKVVSSSITVSGTSFAIETKNEELKSLLKVGTFVKCQYEFDEGFANIKEASGFHSCHILNGVEQDVSNGYNNPNYPRSMFGCDNNGKVYLIATERSTEPKDGMRGQEMTALMMQYGITLAFQCDGGGSVQSICRNEDGVLDYAQVPYEGDFRPVLTGHFIAMKVDNISLNISDVDNNSAKINVEDFEDGERDLAIKLFSNDKTINEQIIDLDTNELVLENLKKYTKYNVQVLVKENDSYRETYIKDAFITLKDFPEIEKVNVEIKEDHSYEITILIKDVDEVAQKASIYLNGKKKSIKINDNVIKISYDKNTEAILNMYFEFDCIFNGDIKTIRIDDYDLEAGLDVYIENIKSHIDAFFNFE